MKYIRAMFPGSLLGFLVFTVPVAVAVAVAVGLGSAALASDPVAEPGADATPVSPAPKTEVSSGGARAWSVAEAAPGGEPYGAQLQTELARALASKPVDYKPRTHHLADDGSPKFTNRLILETSPYLGQHAHNPVDFHPWGDEAFEKAARLDRPILLSVGYSTCHWCHVMERESFEDLEIATFINANFVAIKVDREERPDVDNVYMDAVRMLTRGGGWPMTVVMTPDRQPFFGGTYFPARTGDRGSRKGFLTILRELSAEYRTDREGVVGRAAELTERMQEANRPRSPGSIPAAAEIFSPTVARLASVFDREWGGFGRAPKFPRPANIEFLLRHYRRTKEAQALELVTTTLDKMADGGMYDHVGGGFHRYSVDARWLVPHFEKMLYDNAQLVWAYLDAYQVTDDPDYARVARETLDYVSREMTDPSGGFYSATDADSPSPGGHDEEGLFFTWTPSELNEVLGTDLAKKVIAYYGVTERGNFEGRTILHTWKPAAEVAKELGTTPEALMAEIETARGLLYRDREKRLPPIKDKKVLTAWNGLMISAFAKGAAVLRDERYARVATEAATFVLRDLKVEGELRRSYMDGRARHAAVLDDYTYLAAGLLDLFEVTSDPRWLDEALALHQVLEERFWDPTGGGFYFTSADSEKLLIREKPDYDGARPSGNSVAVLNLLRLAEITGERVYRQRAEQTLAAFALNLRRGASGVPKLLSGLEGYLDLTKQIVLVVPEGGGDVAPFLDELAEHYLPNRMIVTLEEGPKGKALRTRVPLAADKKVRDGKVTAYVCEQTVCKFPTTDREKFGSQLKSVAQY